MNWVNIFIFISHLKILLHRLLLFWTRTIFYLVPGEIHIIILQLILSSSLLPSFIRQTLFIPEMIYVCILGPGILSEKGWWFSFGRDLRWSKWKFPWIWNQSIFLIKFQVTQTIITVFANQGVNRGWWLGGSNIYHVSLKCFKIFTHLKLHQNISSGCILELAKWNPLWVCQMDRRTSSQWNFGSWRSRLFVSLCW